VLGENIYFHPALLRNIDNTWSALARRYGGASGLP
jgi:hypothetical protein